MGAVAPVVGAVAGGLISSKGSKKAAKSANAGNKYAEAARQEATGYVQPDSIYKMSEWMFPGLLPKPNFNMGADPNAGSNKQKRPPNIQKNAINFMNNMYTRHFANRYDPTGKWKAFYGKPSIIHQKVQAQEEAHKAKQAQQASNQALGDAINQDPQLAAALSSALGLAGSRATGGPVAAGASYLVGEGGPEIMTPVEDGIITPNPATPMPNEPPVTTMPANPIENEQANPDPDKYANMGRFASYPIVQALMDNWDKFSHLGRGEGSNEPEPIQGSELGGLAMDHATSFLQNPGQLNTASYEREQEQANQALNTNSQALMGALTGRGIDPRSGLGQSLMLNAGNYSNRLRSEAARDLSLQQEALRREDIQSGMTAYSNFLNQVFGIIGQQAGTAGGGSFSNPQAINPYGNLGSGIASAGSLWADYSAQKAAKNAPQAAPYYLAKP